MDNIFKYMIASLTGIISTLAPIEPLIMCAAIFTSIDFITGILADRQRTLRANREWVFKSKKAWRTIIKLCFIMAGITLAWLIDSFLIPFKPLNLAKIFTGFVCGVEFWSYLENASEITGYPIFNAFTQFMKKNIKNNYEKDDKENK